jgi:Bacterial TSP3 repeat
MAQDPQNQYYSDNSQSQNNNYNPQNYDPAFANQNNYNQGQPITDQNVTYQYPVDSGMTPQPVTQAYDPAQYYQPQPAVQSIDPNYQYSQPQTGTYPIDNTQANYQAYTQPDVYGQSQSPTYTYEGMAPAANDNTQPSTNYNPITNTFDPIVQNYSSDIGISPVQDYNNQDFNSQTQPNQFSQDQYNNFDPNYTPENQFDPSNPQPDVHEGGFFSNKRNLIIIGLIVLMVGLISASGILFYLRSQDNGANSVQNSQSSAIAQTTAPSTVTSNISKPAATNTPVTPSSQTGRAVAVGTTDTGGPGTPATNAKKTNLTKIPAEWVKAKFTENLNDDGSCKLVSNCGEKADPDNDGMTNIDEYNFQTDPLNSDTDFDGFADGDEVKIYYTDPAKKDSDNDTYEDGDEVTNCYDPITATSSKLSTARKSQITSITTTIPLHKTTLDKLKKANATNDDLDKGYIQIKCGSTNSTTASSSVTLSTKANKDNI